MKRSYPTVAVLASVWCAIPMCIATGGLAVVGCDTQLDIDQSPTVSKTVMADAGGDRLSDALEEEIGTDPNTPDTDGDGLNDKDEQSTGTDPTDFDSDNDGLSDGAEVTLTTHPLVPDTDGDGVNDGNEVDAGTDPLDPASK